MWPGGTQQSITWTYTNVDNIKIEYSLDNGFNWVQITPSHPTSALSYTWTVPSIGSSQARVRITSTLQFTQDESNATFSIPVPSVNIIYPDGGESFGAGTGQYIEWLASGLQQVRVQYTLNNGGSWMEIGTFPAGNNYCNWTPPSGATSQARIRAWNIEDPVNRDSSSAVFSIVNLPTINVDKFKGGLLDGYSMSSNLPDTIRVVAPNGGEVLSPTSTAAITWSYLNIDQIKIEYSTDNGSSWNLIVNDIPASQLSYNWTVPNTPSTQCRLRITSLRTGLFDISDAPFTINAAFVHVVYPNGGESFGTGTGQYIEWEFNSVATVKLEYSTNNGSTWTTIGTVPAASRYANWIPPATVTTQCLIRASDNALASVNDVSSAPFTLFTPTAMDLNKFKGGSNDGYSMNSVVPDSLRLTSPNGGEVWNAASTRNISWTYNDVDNVTIEFSLDDGITWSTLAASVPASQLTYSWVVPTTPSYTCRVRVRAIGRPIADQSDAVFIIPTSFVQITYPNGGEAFGTATGQYIEWDFSDLATLKLEYSTNNGASWTVIGTVPAANKYANWVVPPIPSGQLLIRATDIDNPTYTDQSNAAFSSFNLPVLDVNKYKGGQFDGYSMYSFRDEYVQVIKPNGGEVWGIGSTKEVKWATLNTNENIRLEYSIDNEGTWSTLLNNVPSAPNTYNWTLPGPASALCKVRVLTMSGAQVDKSDDLFTLAAPDGIITDPFASGLTGLSFCSNSSTVVTFSTDVAFNPSNRFIVQLSDSLGGFSGALINIGEIVSSVPAPITVTFPERYYNSGQYRLRVVATDPPTLGTDNGADFAIDPLPAVDLGPDGSICAGTLRTLDATSPGATYTWSTGSLAPTIQVAQAGTYWVVVSNECGTNTDTLTIGLAAPPTVDLGADRQICLNSSTVLLADSGATSYLWSTGAVTRAISVLVPGTYSVTATNSCGTATDNIAISTLSPAVVSLGNDQGLCAGQTVVLDAGNPGSSFAWSNGATSQTITVTAPGTYAVNVTTPCGVVADQVTFFNGAFQVNAGMDRSVCAGGELHLSATGANNYIWSSGQSGSSIIVAPSSTTTYTVNATNVYGCTASDAIVVTVIEPEVTDLSVSITEGDTYLFNGQELNTSGIYTASLVNSAGCDSTVVLNLSVVPGNGVGLQVQVYLEGPYRQSTGLMEDALRTAGLLPLQEPYSALGFELDGGNELTTPSVLSVTGANAIVDWVVVELRQLDVNIRVATQSALLQRDGDVVGMDGISPLLFNVPPGNYHVSVRHRNHLGVMTASPLALGGTPVTVDLRSTATPVFGVEATKPVGGVLVLWAGDVTFNGQVKYTGAANDRDPILSRIGGVIPTSFISGYLPEDVNMDGVVKYTGSGNDRDIILQNIGGVIPTNTRSAQLP